MRITEPYTLFLRTLQSNKKVYYYQFRDEQGCRSTMRSTGTDNLAKAKRIVNQLYRQGLLKKNNDNITFYNFSVSFFEDGSPYLNWKKANGTPIKPETVASYRKCLSNQLMPFFASKELKQITTDVIKQWVVWCTERWSAKTINNAQGVLNIILSSAVEKELILKNPCVNIGKRKIAKKKRVLLTVEELKQIFNAEWTREDAKFAALLTVVTGMRIGEVIALQNAYIHDNFLDVQFTYSRKFGLGSTKTGISRYVPIPLGFVKKTNGRWLFGEDAEKPMQAHIVFEHFCKVLSHLGIDKTQRGITIHSLRNVFISYLQSENISEPKIRAVVGHAETTMTDLYTYWTPEMFPEVYSAQEKFIKLIKG